MTSHGSQMPEEVQPSLFLPFSRASGEGASSHGLGIYIAAEPARAHEGQLEAATTFALTMPAHHE